MRLKFTPVGRARRHVCSDCSFDQKLIFFFFTFSWVFRLADFYQYHSKRAQGVLESFSVIIAAVILWGWLEKRAGVWRGLFTFEGFFFFFFFFLSCDYHSQKESVKRRRCILCNSKQVRTRPWVKKKMWFKAAKHLVLHACWASSPFFSHSVLWPDFAKQLQSVLLPSSLVPP